MAESNDKKLKFMELYDDLLLQLKNGVLAAGDQLPAERVLADKVGMSYMTARQAVQALVDKGYLVRKSRIGTFVPFDISARLSKPTINVITLDEELGIPGQFNRVIDEYSKEKGINTNLIKIGKRTAMKAEPLLADHSRPCVVLMNDLVCAPPLREVMLANPNVMLVGYNLSGIGIKSVLCDDAAAARMAQTILHQAGHTNTALFIGEISHPVSQQIVSGWKSCNINPQKDSMDVALIDLGAKCSKSKFDKKVAELFCKNKRQFTSVITASIAMGLQLCDALKYVGLSVPEDVSIVTLGIAEYLPHYTPKLTCVDPHLDKQIKYAVDSAIDILNGREVRMLHLVSPEIINGESVKILENKL